MIFQENRIESYQKLSHIMLRSPKTINRNKLLDSAIESAICNKAKATAIISAMMLTSIYLHDATTTTEKDLISNQYPHAQAWVESLIKKYPKANFDDCWFIALDKPQIYLHDFDTLQEEQRYIQQCEDYQKAVTGPAIEFGNVKYGYYMINRINDTYKKVVEGKDLTDEESTFLDKQEWLLLRMSQPEKQKAFQTSLIALLVGSIGIDQLIKDTFDRNVAGTILTALVIEFNRKSSSRNDYRANNAGDTNVLEGGIAYLNEDVTNFVTDLATSYNRSEAETFDPNYQSDALMPRSQFAQTLYKTAHGVSRLGWRAFHTAMMPVKYVCGTDQVYKGFNLLLNPISGTKEDRINKIRAKLNKSA